MGEWMSNLIFAKFPVLKIEPHIQLREIKPREDAEPFYNYIRNPIMKDFIAAEEIPTNIDSAYQELSYWSDLFRYQRSIYWAIEDLQLNKMIGTCGFNLWSISQKRTEISYDLDHEYWGRGIMTEALARLLKFAWDEMQVNRIQATVAIHNNASIRVLEKLGFKREGLLPAYGIINNQPHDSIMLGCVRGK